MTNEQLLRIIAGFFIMLSVSLFHFQNADTSIFGAANWLWFTLFVGLNLFQSGFSKWCPMMTILNKIRK
ncbi:MAG: DUF2892 domain-containing protein [Calditrichaeota bacterium]|nr:MAG: DUF2892 domain-containing protein [Calditrichota bacterium]